MSKVDALVELYSSEERQINACLFVSHMADDLSHTGIYFSLRMKRLEANRCWGWFTGLRTSGLRPPEFSWLSLMVAGGCLGSRNQVLFLGRKKADVPKTHLQLSLLFL